MTRRLVINGKFTAQRVTGVQRAAEEIVRALDARPGASAVTLLVPPRGRRLGLHRIREQVVGPSGLPLHVWEQCVLPFAARGALLLNLAGGAPAFGTRQACLLHDAAVFDTPAAYSVSFTCWYRWLFRRLARTAELLLTVSVFSSTRLAQALCLGAEHFLVLPNCADHLSTRPVPIGELEQSLACHGLYVGGYLLAVGSANPNKNLVRLLRAHASLPASRLPLALVGGSDPKVFANVPVDVPADVLKLGAVDDETLRKLYLGARALVFPSLYEGFGLPPLEAMHLGCPVIASDAGALPEVCGDAALQVKPQDVAALADAMRRLGEDDVLRGRLVQAGLRRAAESRWADTAELLSAALVRCGVRV